MNLHEFQELALKTAKPQTFEDGLHHAALGLAGESGEFCDAVKKHLHYGQPADIDNMVEELGDILWYVARSCELCGVSIETAARLCIEKLQKRYPEKYSDELAAARLDKSGDA